MVRWANLKSVSESWHSQSRSWASKHYEACTTNSATNTCPQVWKWVKTFLNYFFDLGPSTGMNTAIFVEIVAHQLVGHTHWFNAVLTLNWRLSLCTAKSINATISLFNAAAVFSIRSSQQLFFMCIPAIEHQHTALALTQDPLSNCTNLILSPR